MTRTLLLVLALEVALASWWVLPGVQADDDVPVAPPGQEAPVQPPTEAAEDEPAAVADPDAEEPVVLTPLEVTDAQLDDALDVVARAMRERRPGPVLLRRLTPQQLLDLARIFDPEATHHPKYPEDVVMHIGAQAVMLTADPPGALRIRHSMTGEGLSPELANDWNYDMRFAKCSVDPDGNFHLQRDVMLLGGVSSDNLVEELRLFRTQFIDYAKRIDAAMKK